MITRAGKSDEEYVQACWERVSIGQPTHADSDGEFALTIHEYRRFFKTQAADCWREAAELTEQRIKNIRNLAEELDLIEAQILRDSINDASLDQLRINGNTRWLRIQTRLWELFEDVTTGLRKEAYE